MALATLSVGSQKPRNDSQPLRLKKPGIAGLFYSEITTPELIAK